jgi:hypothetical protein
VLINILLLINVQKRKRVASIMSNDVFIHVSTTTWEIANTASVVIFHMLSKDKSPDQNPLKKHAKSYIMRITVQAETNANIHMISDNTHVYSIHWESVSTQTAIADTHTKKRWRSQLCVFLT